MTQRYYQVSFFRAFSEKSKTGMTTYYLHHSSLNLQGDWLKEGGIETGRGVTVKISEGCLIVIADSNEVPELREQVNQVKQVVKGIKAAIV
uniref:SymE family type I addiction module toxin n=2 Tax=Citrobacter sp. NCU1 TaxID=2026683 RepID=UPI00313C2305